MRFTLAKTATILPVLGLSAALSAHAANDAATGNQSQTGAAAVRQQGQSAQATAHNMRASKLMGMHVRNAQGEDLGEINDLVVDVNNERVYYAILAFGGFLGMGEKLFAYPVRAFSIGRDGESLMLNVDKDRLKQAPGFDRDRWPDWQAENGYRNEVDRYYGPKVQLDPRPNMLLRRASNLLGADVTAADDDVGDVEDMVVDLSDGKVQYAVVEFDRGWGDPERMMLLPLRAFQRGAKDGEDLALRLDRQQLATAPGFPKSRWPDLERSYSDDLSAWFDGLGLDRDEATAGANENGR